MQLPFNVTLLGSGQTYTVEAVTDTGEGRFYWLRNGAGELVSYPSWVFVPTRK